MYGTLCCAFCLLTSILNASSPFFISFIPPAFRVISSGPGTSGLKDPVDLYRIHHCIHLRNDPSFYIYGIVPWLSYLSYQILEMGVGWNSFYRETDFSAGLYFAAVNFFQD